MNEYMNILVAVDGSSEAKLALHKSIEMVKLEENACLHIVNIMDIFSIDEDDASYLEREQQRIEDLLNSYKAIAKEEGIDHVETHIKHGDPKVNISKQLAHELEADIIICGAQGFKNAEHYFLGSVSEAIVFTASCDVLVVRRNM
ncbi:universal stress protein UspA [Sporosarcina sp. P20a]|uniref:universal stress protein n=1 Tax=Sporosarcina sp. P20a TaxID=2048256 RepID=UPI000C1729C4|nr:universal stress protein [Sporosarcina sp. P20a]PIC86752.1 universal stress protein UspA [Sporosarcina sp. P20a]